jgi:hypothetical protein
MAPLADAAPEESGYTSSMSTSLLTGLSIVVPTKFSSQDKSYNNLTSPTSTTTEAKYDAFLHYSNDQVRMNKLMLKDTTDSDGTTKNETEPQLQQQCTNQERKTRLTRISFEIHPSLLLEDLFDTDLYEDEDEEDCDDIDVLRVLENTMYKQ